MPDLTFGNGRAANYKLHNDVDCAYPAGKLAKCASHIYAAASSDGALQRAQRLRGIARRVQDNDAVTVCPYSGDSYCPRIDPPALGPLQLGLEHLSGILCVAQRADEAGHARYGVGHDDAGACVIPGGDSSKHKDACSDDR